MLDVASSIHRAGKGFKACCAHGDVLGSRHGLDDFN